MKILAPVLRRTPEILLVAAFLIYIGSVATAIAAGNEMQVALGGELPVVVKVRALFLTFVQPLILPLIVLFGAALLWRIDRILPTKEPE